MALGNLGPNRKAEPLEEQVLSKAKDAFRAGDELDYYISKFSLYSTPLHFTALNSFYVKHDSLARLLVGSGAVSRKMIEKLGFDNFGIKYVEFEKRRIKPGHFQEKKNKKERKENPEWYLLPRITKEVEEIYNAGSAYESKLLENLKISKEELNVKSWRSIRSEFTGQLYEQWMLGIGSKSESERGEYEDESETYDERPGYRTEEKGSDDVYAKFANNLRKAINSREVSQVVSCINKYEDDFVNSGIDEGTEGLLSYIKSYLEPEMGEIISEGDLILKKLDVLVSKIDNYIED